MVCVPLFNTQYICKGPLSTFWLDDDNRSSSQIDNFIVDKDYISVVKFCAVYDDDCVNTSDHVPIFLSINNGLKRYELKQPPTYNWTKCDTFQYSQVFRGNITNCLSQYLIKDTPDIDVYLSILQQCISDAMVKCVPIAARCPYKRPYWDIELGDAHKLQKHERHIWILGGRPRGMEHATYREYKQVKKLFAKILHQKHVEYEQHRFEVCESRIDMDSRVLWTYIKSNNGNSANCDTIVQDGRTHSSPEELKCGENIPTY